jgi:hypothetical protein
MSSTFVVALPLLATLAAALVAAVPVGLIRPQRAPHLSAYAALVQFCLVGLAALVHVLSPTDANACQQGADVPEAILWIGSGAAVAGGVVIATSLLRRSHRQLIVLALVLPYVAALVLVLRVVPCLD